MEAATRYPEATAIEVGNRSWTYEEVAGRVEATHLLLREAGVALGDRIGIWMDRSSEAIVGVLAAWSLGSAYVPLSPETLNPGLQTHFPLSRLARMFDDIAPRVVLTDTDAAIPGWDGPVVQIASQSLVQPATRRHAHISEIGNPPAYHIYTSGTTGAPKAVTISQESVLWLRGALNSSIYDHEQRPALRRTLNAPLGFDPSVQQLVGLLDGATLVVVPARVRTHGRELLNFLRSSRIEVLDTTPAQLRLLVDAGLGEVGDYPRLILCGGANLDRRLWMDLADMPTRKTYNLYGVTEATVDSTCALVSGSEPTIGVPLPGVSLSIGDPESAATDQAGQSDTLWISGDSVAVGYWNRPHLTAQRFNTDASGRTWYDTGDIASLTADGRYQIHGRSDRQVKIRSHRVELDEVENVLNLHHTISSAAVIAVSGNLVANVVSEKSSTLDIVELRRHLRSHVPDYMVPQEIKSVESLPLTPNGKIDYGRLTADTEAESTPSPTTAPTGDSGSASTISLLRDAWAEALPEDMVLHPDSDFFESGGDSLSIIAMLTTLEDVTGTELPLADLVERPIFGDHVRVLDELLQSTTER
ncbi:MAG: non-ribosomal peptide synthetase [bacterium]|nr:non-ribosomal peptide synthetase [bacterium]